MRDGGLTNLVHTSLGYTGHISTRRVFVPDLGSDQDAVYLFLRVALILRARTGPGPGYNVSIHVGSLTWISSGLMRTIGPVEKQPTQSLKDLDSNPGIVCNDWGI